MNIDAQYFVNSLKLQPHPEGGWYKEVYRSEFVFTGYKEFPEGRSFCTSIYFLLTAGNFSAFHKIRSDEIWHFYAGDPLEVIEIDQSGSCKTTILGPSLHTGNHIQYTVPANNWFGSRVRSGGLFSLVGCTVAPGFDFDDFELAKRKSLLQSYPDLSDIITQMTRL